MGKVKGSGKKKKLIINEKSRSSDSDEAKSGAKKGEKSCKHVNKAVRPQVVENALKSIKKGECKDCRGKPKVPADISHEEDLELARSVCICFRCGYQGCSRSATERHAHSHFLKEPQHSLCINTTTWMVWCYACDREVSNNNDHRQVEKTTKMIRDEMSNAANEDSAPATYVSGTVKGLRNLGNTCFFNSVLQNISQIGILVQRLDSLIAIPEEVVIKSEKSPTVELIIKKASAIGPLTSALKCFLDDFHSSSRGTVAPSRLFGEITKKSPQFRGYRQQDSQELLRYLLDGMRVEELKRIETGMKEALKSFELPPTKEQQRECINNARTFVDDVFGGSLASTIVCSQCKTKSQVYDNFLDLSLPVNTIPKESAKSAASKLLSGVLKNERNEGKNNQEEGVPRESKLSKHQLKTKQRKEKKAKRCKGKISHNQRGSKEGSLAGDDTKSCKREEGVDDDVDRRKDEPNDSAKFSRESDDSRSTVNISEDGDKMSFANFDPVERYSIKDDAEFVIIDRISDNGNDQNVIPKQAILGGNSLRSSQYSNKSSLESLVSGETSSLTSTRCVSSREDISFENELSPRREDTAHAEEPDAVSNGSSIIKSCVSPSAQPAASELAGGSSSVEDCLVVPKDIADIASALDSSLKLNGKINDEEQIELDSKSCDGAAYHLKEDEDATVKMECGLANDGGGAEESGGEVKQQKDLQVVDVDGEREASSPIHQHPNTSQEKEEIKQEADDFGSQQMMLKDMEGWDREDTLAKERKEAPSMEANDCVEVANDESQENPAHDTNELITEGSNEIVVGDLRADDKETLGMSTEELLDKSGDVDERNDLTMNYEQADSYDSEEDNTDIESDQENNLDETETVGPEYICKAGECSISSCLRQFTSKDVLEGNNKFRCDECTRLRKLSTEDEKVKPVFTEATKQMLLWKPPPVLTLHLKRFEQVGRGLRKVNKHIEFPLELDLSPFCLKHSKVSHDNLQYSLCGIVEHSGSLHGGHYVSCVKTRTADNKVKWYYISDSRVSEIQEEAVLRKQAYILFYHQRE